MCTFYVCVTERVCVSERESACVCVYAYECMSVGERKFSCERKCGFVIVQMCTSVWRGRGFCMCL